LLCTAGFPALYTQVLTLHDLPVWQYYGYLALYNLAYVLDDGLMVTLAVVTLGRRKLQEREGRWLKLVSGLAMLGLGLVLLGKPEWLA
jgi:threonine/homoserine/homoserine lactone efflux protein